MGILLCFSDSQLLKTHRADIFAEGAVESLLFKCDTYIRHFRIILCGTDKVYWKILSRETGKVGINKGAGDLACAVRPEVYEDD